MRQAFRKLDINTRVELTRIVMQQSQQPATANPMQGIVAQPPSLATRRSLSSKSLLPKAMHKRRPAGQDRPGYVACWN